MKNRLILFTADYPFNTGETFLETEIDYLCKGFDEVLIVSSSISDQQTRTVPENCRVERIDLQVGALQKFLSLFQVFNPLFWKELNVIRKIYQLPIRKGILSTMLVSLWRGRKVAKRVSEIIQANHPSDHLYFYSYWCDDAALGLATAQERYPRIKTFCRIHRWDVYFDQSAVGYLPFRHYITAQLKAIFSISKDGIDYAHKVWKTGQDQKFQLSRLGINNDFPLRTMQRDYFLLVSCSNLIPVKRVHLIAEALQLISNHRIHWVHIGDGPERGRIEEETAKLPTNVTVELKGRIPNPSIYAYYDEVRPDLFINVSASEGVPVSIMEAMSFGISVLATDVGGNREIVDEENGRLINDHIDNQLKNSIEEIVRMDKLQREQLSISSFKKWETMYKAELNFNQFVDLIRNI